MPMKRFFDLGDSYARQSSWKDFALTKLCLFSMGLALGTQVKEEHKKAVLIAAAAGFAASYVPLMTKLFKVAVKEE